MPKSNSKCSKRNPEPPCPSNMGERKNKKGSVCCYKGAKPSKANNNNSNKKRKTYKFKRVKASNKPTAKERTKAKLMRNELLVLSKDYQAHKANQVVKKSLAKTIKANNLQRAKLSLKSRNSKNSKNNKPTKKRKRPLLLLLSAAKKIKANNLQRAKLSLKSRNSKNSKNNKPTKKRKRCPNGQRKNKKGECVSKK